MAPVPVYADATVLIGLSRIGQLGLLTLLPIPVRVTVQVWAEVTDDADNPGVIALRSARDDGLLAVVEEGDPTAFPQLDPGEATVLTAAAAVRAAVLVDERKARLLIDRDPTLRDAIPLATGTIG